MKSRLILFLGALLLVCSITASAVGTERKKLKETSAQLVPASGQSLLKSGENAIFLSDSSYCMNFEVDEDLAGWQYLNVNTDESIWSVYSGVGIDSSQCIAYRYSEINRADDWLTSPAFALDAGNKYEVSFYYAVQFSNFPEKFKFSYGTDNTRALDHLIADLGAINNEDFLKSTDTITMADSGTFYFGWHCYSEANMGYLKIDSVVVREIAKSSESGGDNNGENGSGNNGEGNNGDAFISTAAGGFWHEESTWVKGAVPGESDNVVIDGPVTVFYDFYESENAFCNNLTVNKGDSLSIDYMQYGISLHVKGDILNNGVICNKENAYFRIFCGGDVENHGTFKINTLRLEGEKQHLLKGTGAFEIDEIEKDENEHFNLFIDGEVTLSSTYIDMHNDSILMDDNSLLRLTDPGNIGYHHLENIFFYGGELFMSDDCFIQNASLENIKLSGLTQFKNDVHCRANVNIADTLQQANHDYPVTIYFDEDITVDALVRNNPDDNDWVNIEAKGDVTINNNWNIWCLLLSGDTDQNISIAEGQNLFVSSLEIKAEKSGSGYQWVKDGTEQDGASEALYVEGYNLNFDRNSNHTYYCKLDGGNSRSIVFNKGYVVSGISGKENIHSLLLYPNPAKTYITIHSENAVIDQISIYNSRGAKVLERKAVGAHVHSIGLENLVSGLYFVKAMHGNTISVNSFIIKQ